MTTAVALIIGGVTAVAAGGMYAVLAIGAPRGSQDSGAFRYGDDPIPEHLIGWMIPADDHRPSFGRPFPLVAGRGGTGSASLSLGAPGDLDEERASDRQADGARGEVEGVPVHAPENTDAAA